LIIILNLIFRDVFVSLPLAQPPLYFPRKGKKYKEGELF
jgi:hypothetical protein